jgi:hypothetical protein
MYTLELVQKPGSPESSSNVLSAVLSNNTLSITITEWVAFNEFADREIIEFTSVNRETFYFLLAKTIQEQLDRFPWLSELSFFIGLEN